MRTRTICPSIFALHILEIMLLVALLSIAPAGGPACAAEPWPHIDLPPKGDVQWVARSLRVNGVPTSILQFQSPLSQNEILDYYRSRWSGGFAHVPQVHALGDASVMSQERGSYLMTVKVEGAARGASHGLISVALLAGARADLDPAPLLLLSGSAVISVLESDDGGVNSRQVMILSPHQPASVAQFYESSLDNAGWQRVQATDNPTGGGSFLVYALGAQEVQLSIARSRSGSGSTVLANIVTKGTVREAQ